MLDDDDDGGGGDASRGAREVVWCGLCVSIHGNNNEETETKNAERTHLQ
jgi:hypothetical protein